MIAIPISGAATKAGRDLGGGGQRQVDIVVAAASAQLRGRINRIVARGKPFPFVARTRRTRTKINTQEFSLIELHS